MFDETAETLIADDRFEMGGETYLVTEAIKNPDSYEHMNIGAYPVSNQDAHHHILMIVPRFTKFKIQHHHNQRHRND